MEEVTYTRRYCEEIVKQRLCGPNKFRPLNFKLGKYSADFLQNYWLAHINADDFALEQERGNAVIATTGFGLTGVPHIGIVSQIIKAVKLQEAGIPVQIVLGDLDAYCGKAKDLSYVRSLEKKYRNFITELGFNDALPNVIRTQYNAFSTLRTMYLSGYYLTDEMFEETKEDVHDYYSRNDKIDKNMTYRIKLSINLMVADFLDLYVSSNYKNVLIFLGIDEYKYVGIAMNMLKKAQEIGDYSGLSLSGMFSITMRGFDGYPKMGKSFPYSGITPLMDEEEIYDKIMNRENEYDTPEDSIVFQMLASTSFYSLEKIKEAKIACSEKGKKWEKLKEEYVDVAIKMLKKWND